MSNFLSTPYFILDKFEIPDIIKENSGKFIFITGENMEADYIVVKALEDGVTVMGLTRGKETNILHTEKLNRGEVWLCQFTEDTSAIKIRGKAKVYTKFGEVDSGQSKKI